MSEAGTSGTTCPSCGKEASGNFCQHCGTPLGGRFCNKCGSPLAEGAKFCNQCGAARSEAGSVRGGRGGGTSGTAAGGTAVAAAGGARRGGGASTPVPGTASSNVPWFVAGAAIFGLILAIGFSMVRPAGPAAPAGAPANPAAGAAPDISQMSPREAADRLFTRVMETMSAGDTAGALAFQPMAVQAHVRAEPLDLDGVFHLAMLEMLTDPTAAVASAERILEVEPNHILALGVKGQAYAQLGDADAARAAFQQLLDNYDQEASRPLGEYTGHAQLLSAYRADAEAFLSGG